MYTDHYGLTGRPFQLTPDPAFYFDSATHRKAMAYLGYGLAQGEGFIVITGDIGAGKTTLVGHLMATIDRARLTAVRLVSTQVEGDDMLRLTAQGLGVPVEGAAKAQLLDRVERFLHDQLREGRRTLLIVDEAQNLTLSALEELRMLSNFQAGGEALLQIVLLGQPEFREKLQQDSGLEQLRQRVIATHHLDAMGMEEVRPYLEHRLALVGWNGDPRFTDAACAALHAASGGIPRTLNTLASRLLLHGAIEDLGVIDADAVAAVTDDMGRDAEVPAATVAADPAFAVRLAELETRTAELTRRPAPSTGDPTLPGRIAALEARTVEIARRPAIDPARLDAVERQIADLARRPVEAGGPAGERIAALEARVEEQDAVLRRVLTLLIDWAEDDGQTPRPGVFRRSALS